MHAPQIARYGEGKRPSRAWRKIMSAVYVGKSGVAGTGLALAILGLVNIVAHVTQQYHWIEIQRSYLDYFALGGAVLGSALGWLLSGMR